MRFFVAVHGKHSLPGMQWQWDRHVLGLIVDDRGVRFFESDGATQSTGSMWPMEKVMEHVKLGTLWEL